MLLTAVGGVQRVLTLNSVREEVLTMEPYDEYMEPDMLLLDEIRQTVTAPTKPFLLPRSASPKAPRQRTVKASAC